MGRQAHCAPESSHADPPLYSPCLREPPSHSRCGSKHPQDWAPQPHKFRPFLARLLSNLPRRVSIDEPLPATGRGPGPSAGQAGVGGASEDASTDPLAQASEPRALGTLEVYAELGGLKVAVTQHP